MKLQLQLYTLIAGFLLLSSSLLAQHTVRGTVSDEEGNPLIGVTVLEAETSNGTVTDAEGQYSFEISSPNTSLVFR